MIYLLHFYYLFHVFRIIGYLKCRFNVFEFADISRITTDDVSDSGKRMLIDEVTR